MSTTTTKSSSSSSPSLQRHTFSLASTASVVPPPPPNCLCVISLHHHHDDASSEPLARLILPPTFDYTQVEAQDEASSPRITKKKRDQSKYQKKFGSQYRPYVSIKTLAAAHSTYITSIVSSLPYPQVPTGLYAPHLGVSFLVAPTNPPSPAHTVSVAYYTCPNLVSLLPSKSAYEAALLVAMSAPLGGKERAQKTVATFLSLVAPLRLGKYSGPDAPELTLEAKVAAWEGESHSHYLSVHLRAGTVAMYQQHLFSSVSLFLRLRVAGASHSVLSVLRKA